MSGAATLRTVLATGSPYPTSAEDRVRSGQADPEDTTPYAVFTRTRVDREFGLDNTLLAKTETFRIFCWGATPAQAQQLESEIETTLLANGLVPLENEEDGVDFDVGDNVVLLNVSVVTTPEIS